MTFDYTKEWYGGDYVAPWLPAVTDKDSLFLHYEVGEKRYAARFREWFRKIPPLTGRMLELGFNDGKTIYWMSRHSPDLVIDATDWNEELGKLVPWIKELAPKLEDVRFGDILQVKFQNKPYDFISSLDFFEHLPPEIYPATIRRCWELLRGYGVIFVYVGTARIPEHINIRHHSQVIQDMQSGGFEHVKEWSSGPMNAFRKI